MKVIETPLKGVLIIEPKVYGDSRGFFLESFQQQRYADAGMVLPFVQDNVSRSCKGTLRGLHYQTQHPQGKLVFVTRGEVFDVAVDLRLNSPSFGKWFSVTLSEENHRQLYLPPGCAHGFCVLSAEVDFIYKCTDYYHPETELTIYWKEPELKIDWPIEKPLLSDKDLRGIYIRDIPEEQLLTY